MNLTNFLFSHAQKLQDIDFYKHEFILQICCGNYSLSLAFSKMLNSNNVDIKEILEKMFKMSPPPLYNFFASKDSGKSIQNFFRNSSQKKNANNSLNKSKEMLLYYYLLHYIQLYYDPNARKIDYTNFFLNSFLIEFSDPKKSIKVNGNNITGWAEQLFQYMSSSLDIPQNQFQIILKGLLTFATQNKALYYSLKPQVSSILARVGAQNYIPILEFNIFDVLLNIDPSILILLPPNLINSSNISNFLQYPTVLLNNQFINLAQNLIGATEPFPLESSLFKESNLLTLVNHMIMKRKHFVDIVFSLAHNTLMTRDFNNVEIILDVFSSSPQSELKPWLMLVDFNDLYPDKEFLLSVIPLYLDSSDRKNDSTQNTDSIQNTENEYLNISSNKNMSMLVRLKNDDILLNYIKQTIGINIISDDFSKESLPKYMSSIIRNTNLKDFEHLSKLEYFIISDHDRDMDFNFIFLYLIYSFILHYFQDSYKKRKEQETNENDNDYRLNADQIDQYLQNVKINQDILIDIFSLLFIQDQTTGEYLASIEDAEVILSVLVQYAHDFIKKDKKSSASNILSTIMLGFTKVQQFVILNNKSTLAGCFISSIDTIISALEKHDYEIAKRFASQSNSQKLLILIRFSETIYLYEKSRYNEDIINNFLKSLNDIKDDKIIQRFLVELSMSTNDKINELSTDSFQMENESFQHCLSMLIQKRQKNKNSRNTLLKCSESMDNLKDIINESRLRMFFGGNDVYLDLSDNEDDNERLVTSKNYPILSNFIEHYELFIKLSLNQSQENSSLATKNSDKSLDLIIDSIIQSDKIDSWETCTQLIGSNALEMIILHCDLTKASEQITSLISEQMPIIGELIKIQKKYQNNDIIISKKNEKLKDSTVNKILELVNDKNKNLTDILTNKPFDEQIKMNNSSISLFSKLLDDYSNIDKSLFIITLFKIINESFPNKFDNINNLSSSFFITSENLIPFIDIIDDILSTEIHYNHSLKKVASLLINEIFNFFDKNNSIKSIPFPTEFIYELRIKCDTEIVANVDEFELFLHSNSNEDEYPFSIFLPSFASDKKKNLNLSLIDLVNIFPEKASKTIYFFIDHGITSSEPKEIIKQLIEQHRIFYAIQLSKINESLELFFNNELINYTTMKINQIIDESKNRKIQTDENNFIQHEMKNLVRSIFSESTQLAKSIYSKLPTNLIHAYYQITEAFQSLSFPPKKSSNDSLLAIEQKEDQNIYDEFNQQINNLLHEEVSLEYIQNLVDYIMNIYLNPNIINELDDEYSIYIKSRKLIWSKEQEKMFINNIRTALALVIETHYSHISSIEEERISLTALKKSINIIRKITFSFNLETRNSLNDKSIFYLYTGSLGFLLDYVSEQYNLRFNEKYSLNDINKLMKICVKYDNFELIKKNFMITFLSKDSKELQNFSATNLFVSSIQNCFVDVAKNLLLLNQTDEYIRVLDFLSYIRNMLNCDSKVDLSDLLRILSHPNFIEINFNKDIVHVEVSPVYYRVKMIIEGNMALVNKEFFKLTDRTISCFNGEKDLIKFHNKYGRFEIGIVTELQEFFTASESSSFWPIEDLITNKEFIKAFLANNKDSLTTFCDAFSSLQSAIDNVIFPSLSYDHWNGLLKFVARNLSLNTSTNSDLSKSRIRAVIDDFLEFLRERNMMLSLFDIESRLQMREDAILVASEIFRNLYTWRDRANYSIILKELCENEMNSRKNEGKKPEKVSDGVLNAIYEKASIYSEFCQFCHDTKTNFDQNLDVFVKGIAINSNNGKGYSSQSRFQGKDKNKDEFNSRDNVIDLMAFLAFVKKNFILGLKIAGMKPRCVIPVIRNSIETVFIGGNNEIKSFMIELKKQLYVNSDGQANKAAVNSDYQTISIIAVECIEKKISRKAGISKFIIDFVSGNTLQVYLLVKYGFPYEALNFCNHDIQNIQIIQEYALKKKDTKLFRECKKLLSS